MPVSSVFVPFDEDNAFIVDVNLDVVLVLMLGRVIGILVGKFFFEARRRDERRKNHEDDEQNQKDVGKWRDVDLRHYLLILL